MYITRLASNEIFSPSNKTHHEVDRAKDLSGPRYNHWAELEAELNFPTGIVKHHKRRSTENTIIS
jgi:hypothetical protein